MNARSSCTRTPISWRPLVAARLAIRLVDAQQTPGAPPLVLTGGRIAEKIYAALKASPVKDAVDWSRVDMWWGDERFLPSGHPRLQRDPGPGRAAGRASIPPDRIHPMPASDGPDGDDADAAAVRYAKELAAAGSSGVPQFDIVLLGIGEEGGHAASMFPESSIADAAATVSAVYDDSPKPPLDPDHVDAAHHQRRFGCVGHWIRGG